MFYIKHYFKTLIMKPMHAFLWGSALCGLMISLLFEGSLSKNINDLTRVKDENPHFFAMVPTSASIGYLQRKLSSLPGVKRVKKVSQKVLSKKVEGLIAELKDDESLRDFSNEFSAIDVVMTKGLKKRSQNLIRDYIKRVSTSKEITLGPIIENSAKKYRNSVLGFIQKKLLLIVVSISFFLYILSNALILKELRKQSFLIENFQRKKLVFSKSFTSGQVPILLALVVAMSMQNSIAYFLFASILMALFVVHIMGKSVKQW